MASLVRDRAPELFRQVSFHVAAIVKDAPHLDHVFIQKAVQKKMTGRFHDWAAHSASAEPKMIGAGSSNQDFRPFLRSGTFRIGANVTKGLYYERCVAPRTC